MNKKEIKMALLDLKDGELVVVERKNAVSLTRQWPYPPWECAKKEFVVFNEYCEKFESFTMYFDGPHGGCATYYLKDVIVIRRASQWEVVEELQRLKKIISGVKSFANVFLAKTSS
jgi:hypothetical protein